MKNDEEILELNHERIIIMPSTSEQNYKEAVRELYFYITDNSASNYSKCLYWLIFKADSENLERIRLGYPDQVKAWENWQNSKDQWDFFKNIIGEKYANK